MSENVKLSRGRAGGRGSNLKGPQAEAANQVVRIIEEYLARIRSGAQQQKLEELTGDRGSPEEMAARIRHLKAFVESMPGAQSSRNAAGATPTAAEHNALVADITKIFGAVNALRVLL